MDREQAKNLVQLYDNYFPESLVEEYPNYYQISLKQFEKTLDKFVNKNFHQKK